MNEIVESTSRIVASYAADEGRTLTAEAGPDAVAAARELQVLVLARVREVDPLTVRRFAGDPGASRALRPKRWRACSRRMPDCWPGLRRWWRVSRLLSSDPRRGHRTAQK